MPFFLVDWLGGGGLFKKYSCGGGIVCWRGGGFVVARGRRALLVVGVLFFLSISGRQRISFYGEVLASWRCMGVRSVASFYVDALVGGADGRCDGDLRLLCGVGECVGSRRGGVSLFVFTDRGSYMSVG